MRDTTVGQPAQHRPQHQQVPTWGNHRNSDVARTALGCRSVPGSECRARRQCLHRNLRQRWWVHPVDSELHTRSGRGMAIRHVPESREGLPRHREGRGLCARIEMRLDGRSWFLPSSQSVTSCLLCVERRRCNWSRNDALGKRETRKEGGPHRFSMMEPLVGRAPAGTRPLADDGACPPKSRYWITAARARTSLPPCVNRRK